MAVDSAGYSTSTSATSPFAQGSLFSQKNYDPTGALSTGLQSAATYDPTTQTSSPISSVSGAIKSVQSINSDAGQQSSANQSQTSVAPTAGLLATSKNAYPGYSSVFNYGANAVAGAQALNAGVTTAATTDAGTTAGTATSGAQATSPLTSYSGPNLVSVRTASGNYAYYAFNPTTGQYTFQGQYNRAGQQQLVAGQGGAAGLTAQQRASATLTNIGVGQQLQDSQVGTAGAGLVAQQYQTQLGQWAQANQAAQANASATANVATTASVTQQALDYMTTHGGALPPDLANVTDGSIVGNTGALQAQRDGIAAAQAQYQAQQQHAATLANLQAPAIDTSNVDNTNQEALNSLISQYATNGVGGLASRGTSNQALGVVGQNSLSHDTAAATQYDTNLSAFGSALTQQNNYDTNATGNQLFTDIQGVNDTASQLQQEIGQLGTQARQRAQTQLDSLNQQIAAYHQAVQAYGQASGQAVLLARGILGAASTVSASIVGK